MAILEGLMPGYLRLDDYEKAKQAVTRRIAGDGMTREELLRRSRAADRSLIRTKKIVERETIGPWWCQLFWRAWYGHYF